MILTLSEARLYGQKALCAAGAAPGIDEEGGFAAAWLEARGIPAFESLAEALARWTGDPEASRVPIYELSAGDNDEDAGGAVNLDAEGRSAVFIGRVLIDLAVATATNAAAVKTVTVRNLAHPQYLLPHAADCQRQGLSFALTWTDTVEACRDQATIGQAIVEQDCNLALHGEGWADHKPDRTVTALLSCYDPNVGETPPPPALPLWHTAAELDARFDNSLSKGILVDDGLWECVAGMAARTYVPATAESRARGAGSTASDNE